MIKSLNRSLVAKTFICSLIFLSACSDNSRKKELENAVNMIHIHLDQQITTANELADFYHKDPSAYKRTFKDSNIFIMGYINRIDTDYKDLLLENIQGLDIVCRLKDSTALSFLKRSDRVLFKGTCMPTRGYGLILIEECELAQLVK
ncbi:hypothetical protein F0919_14535 [Taibaiella lutea]|uniref:Lipoprotein n=1 Tax=Taibaiella lutea TaxID=2608001 RepID=A0A5M6CFC2_9BACT|nr:hypothetical protein [Taibaiella lutea]KAA5533746.1 hypothetical protein F0919_14535 [Taibaiella lutea]